MHAQRHARILPLLCLVVAVVTFTHSVGRVFPHCFATNGNTIKHGRIQSLSKPAHNALFDLKKDGRVQVLYEGAWYDSTILSVSADSSMCAVKYDDGDEEETDIHVATRIRRIPPPIKIDTGLKMEVLCEEIWYACEVLSVSDDGEACCVKYDDSEDEEEDVIISQRIRTPRAKIRTLKAGQKFTGEVQRLENFGAFVDIGAERFGLLHISSITNVRIENIEDYLQIGQMVDVWVLKVEAGRFALTMMPPRDASAFIDAQPDEWFDGTVVHIASFGAFVSVTPPDESAPVEGLVHISELKDGFTKNVDDEVKLGQKVRVRVIEVNQRSGVLSFSMKKKGEFRVRRNNLIPFEGLSSDIWIRGKVKRLEAFGIFVTVTAPGSRATADGLVNKGHIRTGFVEDVSEEAKVGQEVKVRVLSVDIGAGKMSLSMM